MRMGRPGGPWTMPCGGVGGDCLAARLYPDCWLSIAGFGTRGNLHRSRKQRSSHGPRCITVEPAPGQVSSPGPLRAREAKPGSPWI